jgi:cell division protein FtsB
MAAARSTARASSAPRRAAARPRPVPSARPRGGAIRWDRVGRLIVLLAFGIVALLYVHPLWSMWSTRGEAAQRRTEVSRLQAEHQRLERRVTALKNPKALEREARRLGMVRPTERGYVIQHLPRD